ncbi:unnamed protein product [Mycena citricolor]|uniref:Uncharacterized protein n=1 Tax=Mycena citricolor TaxID=2018698 RepID=A0AAD2GVE4_9AGAR|nr:unnamed protein product [Mycena citricolor]
MENNRTSGQNLKKEVDVKNIVGDGDKRISKPNPATISSDLSATVLQGDFVYFLRAVIGNKLDKLVKIRLQRGGWEKWFQVELCLLINHFHDRNNVHAVYSAEREEQVFPGTRKSVDVSISEGGKYTHVLELKCGRNNQSANDLAQDIWDDWEKVGAITGNGNGPLQPKLAAASRVAVCVSIDKPPPLDGNWTCYTVDGAEQGVPHKEP